MVDLVARLKLSPTPAQALGPRGRAALVLAGLIPCATLASLSLARAGGAADPLQAAALTLGLCLAGGAAILAGLSGQHYPHTRLGLCNLLTMLRAAGIAALAGLLVVPGALDPAGGLGWTLVALAAAVLALDGADGWAARRSGLRSGFGARFDVEVDVAFALVTAALAWQAGKVGIWFLALGGLRPAFLLARAVWPQLRAPLPEAAWRKRVAALQMILQVVLLAPVIVPPASQLLAGALLAGVVLSFAVDIRWLMRQPGRQP